MKRLMCRVLVALMVWAPFQISYAGMIGTDEVARSSQAERGAVLNFVSRADVSGQLQALGLDPATAKDRVAAMTDEEVRYLASRIQSMPAGGTDAGAVLLLIVIIAVIWWAWKR